MKEETDPVPAVESLGPGPHAEGFLVDGQLVVGFFIHAVGICEPIN